MFLRKRKLVGIALGVGAIAIGAWALRASGMMPEFDRESLLAFRGRIRNLGLWGPIVYIGLCALAAVFFAPSIPFILPAAFFGVILGTLYASLGLTLGACLSFLAARYAARPLVERRAARDPLFRKIDEGVRREGWRMIMITRMVPIFPFNVQNYAYGLTGIGFWIYALVSWLCMLPAIVAWVFVGGSLITGRGSIGLTLLYLAVGATGFVLLSYLPRLLQRKYRVRNGLPDEEQKKGPDTDNNRCRDR